MKANAFKVAFLAFKTQVRVNAIERAKDFLDNEGYVVAKKPKEVKKIEQK